MHERIRAGDPGAFRQLFQEHAQAVRQHAVRVSGDHAGAEDVMAVVFLEAWRLRGKLRDEGTTPRPWLMGITVNVLRNRARAARRHAAALARMPAPEPAPDFADELVGRLADHEQLLAAKAALEKLRRGEREVFALCVWAGLSYPEAAEALGIPVGTVRSRLSRARTRLRALADKELRQASRIHPEPLRAAGQVQGGRMVPARPYKERNR
ncbi:RNA polymerase sigma factor [Kitasatospora sp. MAP5-34]|uniref:RNA polymerase sigma factor n=1 Tax=Kitasatospora sp. MAP5-34 TaxID=3035102 RepID=UPI0024738A60|nr:RNA polymerase sigma factor [Kitasatospora sp. MAP5-34]MDH6577036.1 RNA polymerase sigma factor (sigma-70 family) [Kitasatospora sp. MAP5-34]